MTKNQSVKLIKTDSNKKDKFEKMPDLKLKDKNIRSVSNLNKTEINEIVDF